MSVDAERSGPGLRDSLLETLDWARARCGDETLREVQRLEAELLALDVEVTIILYLGESVSCPGRATEGARAWREAADRLRRQMALRKRLLEVLLLY